MTDAEFAAAMESYFKFQIGQVLKVRGAPSEQAFSAFGSGQQPTLYRVIERLAQQCPGGIQRHYKLVGFNANGGMCKAWDELEIMLEPAEPFKTNDELLAEEEARRAARKKPQ